VDYSAPILAWLKAHEEVEEEATRKRKRRDSRDRADRARGGGAEDSPLASGFDAEGFELRDGDEGSQEEGEQFESKFSSARMDQVCFHDLTIRLHTRYLFVHQGNCEHVVVFTDVRGLHGGDPQPAEASSYPLCLYKYKVRQRKCGICEIFHARKVAYGDDMGGEEPAFFCNACFDKAHYDTGGALLPRFDRNSEKFNLAFEVRDYWHE
jgi:hypothetical protein